MQIAFISTLCSENKYIEVIKNRSSSSLDPSQRLFNNVVTGLSYNNNITCISTLPVSRNIDKRVVFKKEIEIVNNIQYIYLPFINYKYLRHIFIFIYSFIEVFRWIVKYSKYDKVVICDPLVFESSSVARLLAHLFFIKSVAYITDIPKYISILKQKNNILLTVFDYLAFYDSKLYNAYVFVTKNQASFYKGSNYIVIDDIIDTNCDILKNKFVAHDNFNIVYAGGLYEKFGVEKLARAFHEIKNENLRLIFYGSGESSTYLEKLSSIDNRILVRGFIKYNELKQKFLEADILINTRPSTEPFSKYSFPSKTIVYMCSGIPTVSTRIEGISEEYDNLIIWINDESEFGIRTTIERIVKLDKKVLENIGINAQSFVKNSKSIEVQTRKLSLFLHEVKRGLL